MTDEGEDDEEEAEEELGFTQASQMPTNFNSVSPFIRFYSKRIV